jgi:5-methylcytosine-specific restriction endonuclease McrA
MKHRSEKNQQDKTAERDAFAAIWKERDHVCAECEAQLSDPPMYANFSHILPKGRYNKLRAYPPNIDLLCVTCHARWEFSGERKNMKVYDAEKIAELIKLDKQLTEPWRQKNY